MRAHARLVGSAALAAAATSALGCGSMLASMRPALDPALAGEDRHKVAGARGRRARQRLRFAEFSTGAVTRGPVRERDGETGTPSDARAAFDRTEHFAFTLHAADGAGGPAAAAVRVECDVETRARDVESAGGGRTAGRFGQAIACALADTAGPRWRLALAGSPEAPIAGTLERADSAAAPFAVRPVTRFAGLGLTPPTPLGWEFVRGGRARAAVQHAYYPPEVFLPRDVPPDPAARRALAAAAAALLLVDLYDGTSLGD